MDEGHKFVFFFASYKQRWLHYARSQDSFLENALRLREILQIEITLSLIRH